MKRKGKQIGGRGNLSIHRQGKARQGQAMDGWILGVVGKVDVETHVNIKEIVLEFGF